MSITQYESDSVVEFVEVVHLWGKPPVLPSKASTSEHVLVSSSGTPPAVVVQVGFKKMLNATHTRLNTFTILFLLALKFVTFSPTYVHNTAASPR